jgi:hypothetical protein
MGLKVTRATGGFSLGWAEVCDAPGLYEGDSLEGGTVLAVGECDGANGRARFWVKYNTILPINTYDRERRRYRRCPHAVTVTLSNEG